jgi:hypothetical protein
LNRFSIHLPTSSQGFWERLCEHIAGRLREHPGFPADANANHFQLKDESLYEHGTAVFHFTTYDMRRDRDTVRPYSHHDVVGNGDKQFVLVSICSENPLAYAHVLKVLHLVVSHPRLPDRVRMDLLWVRWLQVDESDRWAPGSQHRLERLSFVPGNVAEAINFVDPATVIRGTHLVPAYRHGRTHSLLGSSTLARETDGDWRFYHPMMYVH